MQKIIFVGTTEFGIPTLEKLKQAYELILIVTQPDRPVGRKQVLTPPPVKEWGLKNNIRVLQPEKIAELKTEISGLNPDLSVVAAYGQIIPKAILDIPKFGSINIHGSILPKYRGASPIQAAIAGGDEKTGVTLIQMDDQMDHGQILATRTIPIEAQDTYQSLHQKLSHSAAELVEVILPQLFVGKIKSQPQDHQRATFTKILSHADGKITWSIPAQQIYNQIRAYNPEPGTWTTLDGKKIKILETEILAENKIELPGKLYRKDNQLAVKTSDYSLLIKKLQPEGKNPMSGSDFLNGMQKLESKMFM